MSTEDPLLDILEVALSLEPAERAKFLEERCQGNPELLQRAKRLLDSEEEEGEDWNVAPSRELISPLLVSNDFPLLGEQIGPWKLVQALGEGGMGTVYLGERTDDAFAKQVAIKVIRQEIRHGAMLERFSQERQIHAGLDHPAIATLIDAGRTEQGSPYFVMDYVPGERIDQYCEQKDLSSEERIRLVLQVCQVVQDIHAMGVVHRDLKPSNIMVQPSGTIKLLDFGVALVLGGGLGPKEGELPFITPAYSSPESVLRKGTTRASDQYSLAVIVQELLTDRRPNPGPTPQETATTLATLGPAPGMTPLNKLRRGSLAKLSEKSRFLRDLRAILGRALHQEPKYRYASMQDFQNDLESLLAGDPVRARIPSKAEKVRSFLYQYRWSTVGVGLLAVIMLGSLVYIQAKGREYRKALKSMNQAESQAEAHAAQMERFAQVIFRGLEDRLKLVPGAYTLRQEVLAIGTEFFEQYDQPSAVPEGLLVYMIDAYRSLGIMRMMPIEGGATNIPSARLAFEKAFQLLPTLEKNSPSIGRSYRALLLLESGTLETRELRLEEGKRRFQAALDIYNSDHSPNLLQTRPEHYLRAEISLAENRQKAGDEEGARAALERFANMADSLTDLQIRVDPFLSGTVHIQTVYSAQIWLSLGEMERARAIFERTDSNPWSHPGGNMSEGLTNTVGKLPEYRLRWQLDAPENLPLLLEELEAAIGGLAKYPTGEVTHPLGLANLWFLKGHILESLNRPREAVTAFEECFTIWRFCIRQDPSGLGPKLQMVEALLAAVRVIRQVDNDTDQIQSLQSEARALLESIRRSDVDHPDVSRWIYELDHALIDPSGKPAQESKKD